MSGEPNPTGGTNQEPTSPAVASGTAGAPAPPVHDRALLRAIFDRAGIGMAWLDPEGRVLESNRSLQRMLGHRGPALRGRLLTELLHPADRATALRQLGSGGVRAARGPAPEVRFLRNDGGLAWGRLTSLAVPASGGDPDAVLVLVQETTERRLAEAALRNTAQRFAALFDTIKEVIFQTDRSGVIQLANPAWRELTGVPVEESIGRPIAEFMHSDDGAAFQQAGRDLTQVGAGQERSTVRFHHASGWRWVEVSRYATRTPEGLPALAGTMFDVTEKQRELEEARRLAEQREHMIATVSHELRAPIAAMLANLDLLADGTVGPLNQEQRESAEAAVRGAEGLSKTVDNLLAVTRLQDGRVELHRTEVDLGMLVGQVYRQMLARARPKEVALTLEVSPDLPLVETDGQQLTHVITELIENAIKYSHRGGEVRVSTARDGESVQIEVADHGPGFRAADLPHLFEPFFRSPEAMRRQIPGTGLGLSIVKQVSDLLAIDIVVGETPGGGATVRLSVPSLSCERSNTPIPERTDP
jgi:two-component system phosphate regulon sensor histidine kinase PhoR